MKNLFNLIVFVCFMILLNSCSTITERVDNSVTMEQSCLLMTYVNGSIWEVNGSFRLGYDTEYIVPAGQHNLTGYMVYAVGPGWINVHIDQYGRRTETPGTNVAVRRDITGTVDLEPGKRYKADFSRIRITPTEVDSVFIGDDGNHYSLGDDEIIYWETNKPDIWYIWRITVKETEGRELTKTYIVKDIGPSFNLGIRYPNILGIELGPTLGFALFTNSFNVRVHAEVSIGLGAGVFDYKFSEFKENFIFGSPIGHIGLTSDFEIGKINIGLGAGYQTGLFLLSGWYPPMRGSPYIQLMLGNPRDVAFNIDFYPGVTPIYSAFGAGIKYRW